MPNRRVKKDFVVDIDCRWSPRMSHDKWLGNQFTDKSADQQKIHTKFLRTPEKWCGSGS